MDRSFNVDPMPRPEDTANAKTEELLDWLTSFKKSSDVLQEKQQRNMERERQAQSVKAQYPDNFEGKLREIEKQ